jgi:hypothetical protein
MQIIIKQYTKSNKTSYIANLICGGRIESSKEFSIDEAIKKVMAKWMNNYRSKSKKVE